MAALEVHGSEGSTRALKSLLAGCFMDVATDPLTFATRNAGGDGRGLHKPGTVPAIAVAKNINALHMQNFAIACSNFGFFVPFNIKIAVIRKRTSLFEGITTVHCTIKAWLVKRLRETHARKAEIETMD